MTPVLYETSVPGSGGYHDVEPQALAAQGRDVHVVDVREPDEFTGELGHVPGAELVPLATLAAVAIGWKPDEDIVLVCRSGARSSAAARQLVALGFSRVMNLRGGMMAYNAAGLAVERGPATARGARHGAP